MPAPPATVGPPPAPVTVVVRPTVLDPRTARFASHEGNVAYIALGFALPLMEGRSDMARRTADGFALTAVVTHALKLLVRSRRPDGSDRQSFPSGHTSAAFSLAASRAAYRPGEAALWYAGAATIGQSRIDLNRHRTGDVLAGAVLGIGIGNSATGDRTVGLGIRF